jgi:hypothetical protein
MAPNFLSIVHGEAFHRLGVHDLENLILVDGFISA